MQMTTVQSFVRCWGSVRFTSQMMYVVLFSSLHLVVEAACKIW
jgi:hypothetical protein